MVFSGGASTFFLPVLPIYYHSLGMDDHQVGVAIGALSVGSIIFRVYSGKAVDRYGGKPVLTAGMILAVAAIVCYQFSDTIATTTVVRFLHGVGLAGYGAAALTTVTLMHEECHTTEAVAMYTLFTMLGMGASASVATWIFNFGGMQLTIFAAAVSTVLAILLFPRRPALKIRQHAVSQTMSTGAVVTEPAVYIPTLTLLASNFCFGSIMTFLPLLMLSRGIAEFGSFYVAYSVAVIFSRVWIGRLCARFFSRPPRLLHAGAACPHHAGRRRICRLVGAGAVRRGYRHRLRPDLSGDGDLYFREGPASQPWHRLRHLYDGYRSGFRSGGDRHGGGGCRLGL